MQSTPEPTSLVFGPLRISSVLTGLQLHSPRPKCLLPFSGLELQQEGDSLPKGDAPRQRTLDTCWNPYLQKPLGASAGPFDPEADSSSKPSELST